VGASLTSHVSNSDSVQLGFHGFEQPLFIAGPPFLPSI